MTVEYSEATLADLKDGLRALLPQWNIPSDAGLTLLNVSENATFRVACAANGTRDGAGPAGDLIIRVHRLNYHSADEIASELAFIAALRAEGIVETPAPIPARDGSLIQTVPSPAGLPQRHAVAFEFVGGKEPRADAALTPWFRQLGALTARMHGFTARWRRPAGFRRKTWDYETIFGPKALWGDWTCAMGLTAEGRMLLGRAIDLIGDRLERFGRDESRFGLIHCDLRLANLLVEGPTLRVIDFDDCGFSWHLYDFAAAISFVERAPIIPSLQEAWVEGYRSVAPLPDDHVAELPVFIAMRRFLLTAWIASHSEVPAARELGADYTAGSLEIAEDLLSRFA